MIDYLQGILQNKEEDYIIVETGNIGYQIFISTQFFSTLPPMGEKIKVHTHLIHKDDVMNLYGFCDLREREVFRHLITVSGIGVKLGLKILSSISSHEIIQAILNKDSRYLTKANGLGRKGSEKIILELERKFRKLYPYPTDSAVVNALGTDKTSVEALLALGYKENEAIDAVHHVMKKDKLTKTEDIVKAALKILAKI